MADKIFIGKVSEKTFSNGGSIIKLSLGDKDKELLKKPGYTNIAIKKSLNGKWYAEIDQFVPNNAQPQQQEEDLPF